MENKERFITIISVLQKQDEIDNKFYNATRTIDAFSQGLYYNNTLLVDQLIDIANDLLPYPKSDWVSWFCYENDYGKNKYTIDNIEIVSAEQLYDYLWTNK